MTARHPADEGRAELRAPPGLRAPALVLNVNNDPIARYLVTRALVGAGLRVSEATSGEQALEHVVSERPDLIVLDVRLPGISGIETCRRLKADPSTASIAVLQTSATFVSAEHRAGGLDAGADGYLVQPIEPIVLVATVRALLRARAAEEELRLRAEALAEATRRKDQLIDMLAHELRNPLAAIAAAVRLQECSDAGEQLRLREIVLRQTEHLARFVDDLLDLARLSRDRAELRLVPVELGAVLSRAIESTRHAFEAQRVTIDGPRVAGALVVLGDAPRLEQVLVNVLTNAAKYSPPGGRVEISLEPTSLGGAPSALVTVRDHGEGIDPSLLERVFEPFFQIDDSLARSRGGIGIGLTTARKLVELHAGSITARSEGLGRGAELSIHLPLQAAASAPPPPRAPSPSVPAPNRSIVLIEDNRDAAELLSLMLERAGYQVQVAHDGAEGLELLLRIDPDVAVVDIGLTTIDGYEIARQTRARQGGRPTRLIAMTGYGRPEDRRRALEAGFDLHLVKPIDPAALLCVLEGAPAPERP